MSHSRLSLPAPPDSSYANDNPRASSVRPRSRSRALVAPPPRPAKRIILCEDGSWLNSVNGSIRESIAIPSNVTRISRAIKPVSSDGIPQVVNYHHGVGAGGGVANKLAGISGGGLNEIIREGYQFIANNYWPGDEIFIFGFSRGAFTARSIAGLIDGIGVLTKEGLPFLPEIFRDMQHKHDDNYVPKWPDMPFANKPSALNPEYAEELEHKRMTRLGVNVKVVGVWETVGALGTPKIGALQRLGLQSSQMKELAFYDTSLGDHIENAFQALALDDSRFAFQPALWEKLEGNRTTLRQVWFPGAHSNVGGGYDDQQIANITLAWMIAQCQPYLDFDLDYVLDQWEDGEQFYEKNDEKVRPWSFGTIFSGMSGVFSLGGARIRKPGRATLIDPTSGRETDEPLMDTREYIHPSVRSRVKLKGPGLSDKGRYEPKSLRDWKLTVEHPNGAKRPAIYWRARDNPEEGFAREIAEAPLKPLELELLEYDPETTEYVLHPSGVRQRRRGRGRRDNG